MNDVMFYQIRDMIFGVIGYLRVTRVNVVKRDNFISVPFRLPTSEQEIV